jgi:hypothetical protein
MKSTILFVAALTAFLWATSARGQSCPTGTRTINSGTVPTTMAYDSIYLGTTANGGSGSGTVSTLTDSSTTVTGTAFIILSKNFSATTPSGGKTVTFKICNGADPAATAPTTDSTSVPHFTPTTGQNTPELSSLRLYPTVSPGMVTITGSTSDLTNAYILVLDESGRTVYKQYNGSGNTIVNLNLGGLINGLYFVQITNGTKSTTQKIIIQH